MKKIQVVGAIILKSNKLLAAQRAANRALGSLWEFPGGKIEPDESPENALARELSEEFGAKATIFEPFTINGDATFDFGEVILHCYYARLDSEIIKTIAHDDLRWVTESESLELEWAPTDVPVIKELAKAGFTYEYRR
ncbi:(deoxy)nucleoside triphosphate pyrophosphohydrolase [Secundilactobacillus paracollinoides]|uniref:8-oxo-dGTP diphosphatase n=1 Tax=Secundilactobacillus paracollinoides TaxID=240427 RepID=A0A1B2IYB0_9LACO|nr:(deoxy)nucleoside triphosphate pyrophosphohydrolase [Secundilactobacillus paracollinoides]ANZ61099.1 7,8-dihydro-8-oxoguanine-triphosphatase [Secundilactobacillus paracollinoides]ANZ67021.1 7,8-dihydro-8-oxoguanine-triphosphatase [Secundilactobacillus paracollinoides]